MLGVLVSVVALIVVVVWLVGFRHERKSAAATDDLMTILDAQTKLLRREKLSAAEVADVRARCKRAQGVDVVCADIESRLNRQ
ncbi:MAG TPA: hypothetical protein VFF06_33295 [Polyangia bacterium]|nr:hypothetical protein [Polyangia bacterium]